MLYHTAYLNTLTPPSEGILVLQLLLQRCEARPGSSSIDTSWEYGFADSPLPVDHPSTSSSSLLSQQSRGLNERGGGGRGSGREVGEAEAEATVVNPCVGSNTRQPSGGRLCCAQCEFQCPRSRGKHAMMKSRYGLGFRSG